MKQTVAIYSIVLTFACGLVSITAGNLAAIAACNSSQGSSIAYIGEPIKAGTYRAYIRQNSENPVTLSLIPASGNCLTLSQAQSSPYQWQQALLGGTPGTETLEITNNMSDIDVRVIVGEPSNNISLALVPIEEACVLINRECISQDESGERIFQQPTALSSGGDAAGVLLFNSHQPSDVRHVEYIVDGKYLYTSKILEPVDSRYIPSWKTTLVTRKVTYTDGSVDIYEQSAQPNQGFNLYYAIVSFVGGQSAVTKIVTLVCVTGISLALAGLIRAQYRHHKWRNDKGMKNLRQK